MRIYSMTATFGKLEHQVLTLTPGLNIIEAPNEWGKSTWCAFLTAMLYGIDTRSKSSRYQLADKDRFVPWSGAPMEGRMDIHWQGRDVTIQRSTKGRIPLGEFRAYETHTGLSIPELTAENCGQQLLGVEKDVFTRSGFLRFTDLPVTEDEQLRSRLNALVTTGDESGNAELLERKLKELKNRCRYNKSGLIPQLRLQKEAAEQKLEEFEALDRQIGQLQQQIEDRQQQIRLLENHRCALRYRTAREHSALLQEALCAKEDAQRHMENLQAQAEVVPSRETAAQNIQQLTRIQEELDTVALEEQMLPSAADMPQLPKGFEGCTARQAVMQARKHRDEINALRPRGKLLMSITMILGAFLLLYSVFLLVFDQPLWFAICAGMGAVYLLVAALIQLRSKKRRSLYRKRQAELTNLYGCDDPQQWVDIAEQYTAAWEAYAASGDGNVERRAELYRRREMLVARSTVLTRGKGLGSALEYWYDILSLWDQYADARNSYLQARKQFENLQTLCTDAPAPTQEDGLSYTDDETVRLLAGHSQELHRLLSKLGQYRGYADSLGSREALEEENTSLERRLQELEKTYAALELALSSLEQARAQLQRRFAPRISRSAQEIMSRLTGGRYDRLMMAEDFSLHAGAQNEDTLRSRHWRSDGTVDQLYLALRLAVARELLPDAPLVLDDAMVRFDNVRLKAALEILTLEAKTRQVILFTCHGRERELLAQEMNNTSGVGFTDL